jgi:hypothetical protein
VSSTFADLKNERQAAVEAILSAGHIPAGMELFTAGDESQMEVIKQWIDESDVYLLILGGRYGSVEPRTGRSYTQLEYEYALGLAKPLFACVITEPALEQRVKTYGTSAIETENPQRLKEFRTFVLARMVRFWEDSKDIKIAVGETLSNLARREDLVGWVRPSHVANMPALADEIARLSKENAALRGELSKRETGDGIFGIGFDEMKQILETKGLMGHLQRYRLELAAEGLRTDDDEIISELCVLGLVKVDLRYSPRRYELTDIGRAFLNRLEAQRLMSREYGEPVQAKDGKTASVSKKSTTEM